MTGLIEEAQDLIEEEGELLKATLEDAKQIFRPLETQEADIQSRAQSQ